MPLRHVETVPTPDGCRADSRLDVWEVEGRRLSVLRQRGAFPDICFDHGLLLAARIEDGVFPEILATISHDVDASQGLGTGTVDRIQGAFFNRLSRDVLQSCSDDFRRGVEALARGCFAGLTAPLFDATAVEHACVAIDTGNIATGFEHLRSYRSRSEAYAHWRNYVTQAWMTTAWGRSYADAGAGGAFDDVPLTEWLDRGPGPGRRRAGMGCTGLWAAPDLTADGRGLHARNFDGAFFSWNRHPVLSLIDERPANPAYLRYAAAGTAGLIYPGGINGMNEAGIAVSLHQMSTVNFTVGDGRGRHDVAPYVQQRILREARTLDEAVDIARDRRHFASWTIVVSHAPSGQALRIELNGSEETRVGPGRPFADTYVHRVEPSAASDRLVQTNHFLAEALRERHDFLGDAHFTKTVGKWQETRARMRRADGLLSEAVSAGGLDTERALAMLADHGDADASDATRGFGRTICKAYSLASSIMRASPDRAAPSDQFWLTVGSDDACTPGPHTPLAGFALDWEGLGVTPVGQHVASTVSPGALTAMRHYVAAFQAYERPRQPDGALFRRKPTMEELRTLRRIALGALDAAVAAAENAGLADPGFRYIRARLRHEAALVPGEPDRASLLAGAAADWSALRDVVAEGQVPVTGWERARILLLSAATEAARLEPDHADVQALHGQGVAALDQVAADLFGADGRVHQDIKTWRKVAAAILADGADAALPDIDFVTVE
ncbi:C45 family autoproteolytic acyltransferase/hydolase [Roseospira navarrensis]|uniref:Peptidase C45 hydrolase domain-containing protein n=1 Tax=Roseospira navarrensis TaxID=140058 RepID=A0A7X1ZDN8_9PROT|nr:C45 family autoproteolytic acyltransferase/hydolase [Roseospira navarrensis]MQX36644.1 hypothetical protein [Roseospira navarrensis]